MSARHYFFWQLKNLKRLICLLFMILAAVILSQVFPSQYELAQGDEPDNGVIDDTIKLLKEKEGELVETVELCASVKEVQFVQSNEPHAEIEEVAIGNLFRVKVFYSKELKPECGFEKVSIQNSDNGTPIEVEAKNSTDDSNAFLTDQVKVEPR